MNVQVAQRSVLAFRLANQHYALPIEQVIEVAAMVALTKTPDAAPQVLGMANRHGKVLPILDLRLIFQLDAAPIDVATLFIVAENKDRRVGLVVDEVYQVKYIMEDTLEASPGAGRFVTHAAGEGDSVFQLINLEPILTTYLSDQN